MAVMRCQDKKNAKKEVNKKCRHPQKMPKHVVQTLITSLTSLHTLMLLQSLTSLIHDVNNIKVINTCMCSTLYIDTAIYLNMVVKKE